MLRKVIVELFDYITFRLLVFPVWFLTINLVPVTRYYSYAHQPHLAALTDLAPLLLLTLHYNLDIPFKRPTLSQLAATSRPEALIDKLSTDGFL